MPVALTVPAVWKIILYLAATLLGSVAVYFLKTAIVKLWNEYQDEVNTKTVTDARTETQTADQSANAQSDALKKIEGR